MSLPAQVVRSVLAAVLAVAVCTHAQTATPNAYDVSTVKPAASSEGGMMLDWANGKLKAQNITLEWLMTIAFHARADQITREPGWAKEKHFDITAKLTDVDETTLKKLTTDQHRALLLALLVERFGLKYHVETKELPTYDLVPAKDGIKIVSAAAATDKNKRVDETCDGCTYWGNNEIRGHGMDMAAFAEFLASQLGRNVHDGTGWVDKIDVNLKWAPDLGSAPPSEEDAGLPPLPQALEKQMGLHLVASRGLVKIYVVDHLDEPSAN